MAIVKTDVPMTYARCEQTILELVKAYPFLRTEGGRSYVYLRGEDGLLEKRYVTTGKSLWGSYTEILDGITEEDFLAFPYGKHVTEGAQTVEAEIRALYE